MGTGVGGFRSAAVAADYYRRYDGVVAGRWPVEYVELDVSTRFGATHVRRSGSQGGVPLLLVHPTSGSSAGWYPLIAQLCRQHTVYTPDTIGAPGRSVQTAPITGPNQLADWLDDVLDGLGLDTVHLLGYSEGGWIALLHAAHTPRLDRVATLTLIEPGGIERIPRRTIAGLVRRGTAVFLARDKPRAVRRLNTWMNGDVALTDEQIGLLLAAMGKFTQRLPTPGPIPADALTRIAVPILMLLGADSALYDIEQVAARTRALLPDVHVVTIPNAGHGLAFQYPDQITARILCFTNAGPSTSASDRLLTPSSCARELIRLPAIVAVDGRSGCRAVPESVQQATSSQRQRPGE